jgi:hypothetical protein
MFKKSRTKTRSQIDRLLTQAIVEEESKDISNTPAENTVVTPPPLTPTLPWHN